MPCPCPPSPLPSLFPVRQGWAVPEASSSGHPSPRGHDRLGGGLCGDGTRPGWPIKSTPHLVEGQLRSPADPGCGLKLRLRGALQEAGPDTCARWSPQMHPRRPGPVSFVLTPTTHPHGPLSLPWWFPGRRARPRAWGPSPSDPWSWPHDLSGLLQVPLLPPSPVALLTPSGGHRPQGEVVKGPPWELSHYAPWACCHAGCPHPTCPNCPGTPLPSPAAAQAGPGWGPGTTPARHPHTLLHPAALRLC